MRYLILLLVLTGCANVKDVTSPMRHMKPCHYNFFAPIAERKYYDLIRQGYSHGQARDSTIRYTGKVQYNINIEYLDKCVCMPWNCDNFFQENPNVRTLRFPSTASQTGDENY